LPLPCAPGKSAKQVSASKTSALKSELCVTHKRRIGLIAIAVIVDFDFIFGERFLISLTSIQFRAEPGGILMKCTCRNAISLWLTRGSSWIWRSR
jgi:hypothetical protein